MLSNRDNEGLMVSGGIDGCESVYTNGKTRRNRGGKLATGSSGIETLEECEHLWVGGLGLLQRCNFLDYDVRVTLNLTFSVENLRSSKVVLLSVNEKSSLHVLDVHLNSERCVGLNGAKVGWKHEFGRGHVVDRRNKPYGSGVT